MIAVDEIRIVPTGVKVHSQLHDDKFVGHTTPNKFRIDFFSDDRSASMTIYEKVGTIEYCEGHPNRFHPSSSLYSEKLLLRGWFSNITVAVYGGILSDIGSRSSLLESSMKGPSLIIQKEGRKEGRSVYIRGMQDLPPLSKDHVEEDTSLDSYSADNSQYSVDRGNKPFQDDSGRREPIRFRDSSDLVPHEDMGGSFYDRPQREDDYGPDMGKMQRKQFRPEYRARNIGGRKTLLPDVNPELLYGRSDVNERGYKDKSRNFTPHQRSNFQQDGSERRISRDRGDRYSYENLQSRDTKLSHDLESRPTLANADNTEHQEAEENRNREWIDGEYEEISEDDIDNDEGRVAGLTNMKELDDADLLFPPTILFNPFIMEPFQLMDFNTPDMSDFEILCSDLLTKHQMSLENPEVEISKNLDIPNIGIANQLQELLEKTKLIAPVDIYDNRNILSLPQDKGKEWVSSLEQLIPLVLQGLPMLGISSPDKYDEYVLLLIHWAFAGLDLTVTSHQAIGVNLRMLKAGINLIQKLCLTTQDVVVYLTERDLNERLIELLNTDNMASSVKLMVVHALDAYLSWPSAIATYFTKEQTSENYSKLVQLTLLPRAARVATALSRLLNKIETFHAMYELQNKVQTFVVSRVPSIEDSYDWEEEYDAVSDVVEEEEIVLEEEEMMVMSSTSNDEDEEQEIHYPDVEYTEKEQKQRIESSEFVETENPAMVEYKHSHETVIPLEYLMCVDDVQLSEKEACDIFENLRKITHTLEHIEDSIAQLPARAFPSSVNSKKTCGKEARSAFYRMLESFHILPSIQALLALPVVSSIQAIYEAVYTFLDALMLRQDGLLYLASNSKSIICISRHLICSNFVRGEIETPGTSGHMGTKLAIHLQCIQCLDQLSSFAGINRNTLNDHELLEIFKVLYSLSYTTFGKYWLAKILSFEDNILILLDCVNSPEEEKEVPQKDKEEDSGEKEAETKQEGKKTTEKKSSTRKSAIAGYGINILVLVLKMSSNVEYLIRHSKAFLEAISLAPAGRTTSEAKDWIRALESFQVNQENSIGTLVEYVKENFAKMDWNSLMNTGAGLSLALRILCHLTHARNPCLLGSSTDRIGNTDAFQAVLKVFASGGVSVFVSAIENLNKKCFNYPCYSQHSLGTVFSFNFQHVIINISENLLVLINHLLEVLLNTPDGKFQPGQITKPIFHLYAGLYTTLWETDLSQLDIITEIVVMILGRFVSKATENKLSITENEECTKLLQDVLSATESHCQNIVPGLILLSHLMPLPLPIIVPEETLEEDSLQAFLDTRKIWDVHMNSVSESLNSLISPLCHSTCIPLLEALIPVCQQIIDLSPTIAKSLTDTIVKSCFSYEPKANDSSTDTDIIKFHQQPIKVLSEIIIQPSAKAGLLHFIQNDKQETIRAMWKLAAEQASHGKHMLLSAAVKLAYALLDPDIDFSYSEDAVGITHGMMIPKPHLFDIAFMILEGLKASSLLLVNSCLNLITILIESDKGYVIMKKLLLENSDALITALHSVTSHWGSPISYDTVYVFCVFVHLMLASTEGRRQCLLKKDLKLMLNWSKDHHPLREIKLKLEEDAMDDVTLDLVSALCSSLDSEFETTSESGEVAEDVTDEDEIPHQSLQDQFKFRAVLIHGEYDDLFDTRQKIIQGNTGKSFSTDDIRQDDRIRTDLVEMAEKFCAGFNLENGLKELTESANTYESDKIRMEAKAKKLKKVETFSTRDGKNLTFIKRSHGLMSINIRGRGRGRGGQSTGRHYDMFRQRKQNTSRPPSMHVDDFLAADEQDAGKEQTSIPVSSPFPPRRTSHPFKREFTPRGRGNSRTPSGTTTRGGFSNFRGGYSSNFSGFDKFRSKSAGNRSQDRFINGRGRGRDSDRTSFSPREGFKSLKTQPMWNSSPRNVTSMSPGGFRGNRGNKTMRPGRPQQNVQLPMNMKWGLPPPARRGRGYVKTRGKYPRSFTR